MCLSRLRIRIWFAVFTRKARPFSLSTRKGIARCNTNRPLPLRIESQPCNPVKCFRSFTTGFPTRHPLKRLRSFHRRDGASRGDIFTQHQHATESDVAEDGRSKWRTFESTLLGQCTKHVRQSSFSSSDFLASFRTSGSPGWLPRISECRI